MRPQLTITLTPDGKVNINGPLADKLLCLKMLAQAIVLVAEYQAPRLTVAQTMPRNVG